MNEYKKFMEFSNRMIFEIDESETRQDLILSVNEIIKECIKYGEDKLYNAIKADTFEMSQCKLFVLSSLDKIIKISYDIFHHSKSKESYVDQFEKEFKKNDLI